jgi:hypothetical protein
VAEGHGGEKVSAGRRAGGWAVSLGAMLLSAYPAARLAAQDTTKGKAVYVKWCAAAMA